MGSPLLEQIQVCVEAGRTVNLSYDEQLDAMEGQRIGTVQLADGTIVELQVSGGCIADRNGKEIAEIPDFSVLGCAEAIVHHLRNTARLNITGLTSAENGFNYLVPDLN